MSDTLVEETTLLIVDDELGEMEFRVRPRAMTDVTLVLPVSVVDSLHMVAREKETSVEEILRQYVGIGLREDIGNLFGDRVLGSVKRVLEDHIDSPEAIETIISELRDSASDDAVWRRWAKGT